MDNLTRIKKFFGLDVHSTDKIGAIGTWTFEHKRGDIWLPTIREHNIITTIGLNYLLNCGLGATSKESAWYIGLFGNNVTPILGDTAGTALGGAGTYGELGDTHYNPQSVRPTFTPASASNGVITNTASKAEFTFLTALTFYGGFLASNQTKRSTSGILFSAKRLDTPRSVVAEDIIYVTYDITLVNST